MTAKNERRLDVLEGVKTRFTPLPDAELMALHRRGVPAYRESEHALLGLFI